MSEPDVIFFCSSVQAIAFPETQSAQLRFVTSDGKLIATELARISHTAPPTATA